MIDERNKGASSREMAEKHDIMWLRYNLYIDKLADRRKE